MSMQPKVENEINLAQNVPEGHILNKCSVYVSLILAPSFGHTRNWWNMIYCTCHLGHGFTPYSLQFDPRVA